MLSLKDMLTIYQENIRAPEITNGGWALDIFSPHSFLLTPGCNIKIPAGFGLFLPPGIGGLLSPKNSSISHFSVSPGQLIHPEFSKELTINLIYHGRSQETIKQGDPLCQLVLFQNPGISA